MRSPATDIALNPRGLLQKQTTAHRLAASLKRHGVNTMFGQSLPSLVHLVSNDEGITQVAYRQENTGGYMADAYARISGKVGVVTAQNGPAAALLVAPLAEALKASIPVLALVQDVNRDQTDRNAFQELDHESMFRPVTKWVRRVIDATRIDDYVDMAFTAATSGRPGPVVLMLPADLLLEKVEQDLASRRESLGHYPLDRLAPHLDQIKMAADWLVEAKRPVVIAGGGIHSSSASKQLARLQEVAHLPVATTVMGKGAVDETHPLSIGVASYFMGHNGSTRHMRSMITSADVVLLVGNRTNQNGTDSWKLYPKNARYIHIDIDPQEIGRNYETGIRLAGDAAVTLELLTDVLEQKNLSLRASQRASVQNDIEQGKRAHKEEVAALIASTAAPLRPERIMAEIDSRLTPESIVVADASYSSIWVANYLTAQRAGMRFITPRGLAGLGWGFPMALGAKVAQPKAPVFCVVGDGGFAHAWAELETAVRMQLPVILVVLNNGILGYQQHAENIKFGDHTDACRFVDVDHAAIARAVGAHGVRVNRVDELGPALDDAILRDMVTLIDVATDPDAFPPVTWYEENLT